MANTNTFRLVVVAVVAAAVVVASLLIAASQAPAIVCMNRQRFLGSFLSSAARAQTGAGGGVCLVAPFGCLGQPIGGGNVALAVEAGEQPNILFVLTDDADLSLLPKMPQIEEHLVRKGTTFPNAFAPFATAAPRVRRSCAGSTRTTRASSPTTDPRRRRRLRGGGKRRG